MRILDFLLIYVFISDIKCAARLWIEPDESQIVLAEGDKLRLDCKHEYRRSENSMGGFKKDGRVISVINEDGYSVSLQKQVTSTGMSSTITLGKDYVSVKDTGIYSCDIKTNIASMSVIIVKVTPEDAEFTDDAVNFIDLSCSIQNPPEGKLNNVTFTWVHENTILQADEKFEIKNENFDGILRIKNPDRNDIGKYECFLGKTYEIATRKSTYVYLKAKANIASYKSNYINHGIQFLCTASGYPRPVLIWTKNNVVLNSSMVVKETDISTTSSLLIEDLNQEDDGVYACAALSELDNENKTAKFEIGPKVRALVSGVKSMNDFCCTRLSTILSLVALIFTYNSKFCS